MDDEFASGRSSWGYVGRQQGRADGQALGRVSGRAARRGPTSCYCFGGPLTVTAATSDGQAAARRIGGIWPAARARAAMGKEEELAHRKNQARYQDDGQTRADKRIAAGTAPHIAVLGSGARAGRHLSTPSGACYQRRRCCWGRGARCVRRPGSVVDEVEPRDVLSAYGMGLADLRILREQSIER